MDATSPLAAGSVAADPFYIVREEVAQSVHGVRALFERWKVIRDDAGANLASHEEWQWIGDELAKGAKSTLWDLQDLEATIAVVENNRARFRIDKAELERRRAFVRDTRATVLGIERELAAPEVRARVEADRRRELLRAGDAIGPRAAQKAAASPLERQLQEDNERFVDGERQRQELIMGAQEQDFGVLHSAVGNLREMSHTIGEELDEHETIIADLDDRAETADRGLKRALRSVNNLIDRQKDSTQIIIILVLIVALIGVIVLNFYL